MPVLVPKDTTWQDRIVNLCVESLESGNIPSPKVDTSVQQENVIYMLLFLVSCGEVGCEEASRFF